MNKKNLVALFTLLLLASCRQVTQSDAIVSMQLVDKNGFSETISTKDRLGVYQNVDFLASQPYEKVLRVYGKDEEGKSRSKLNSYHENGGSWQYLEALDGRANGKYLEWHENGKLKIEAVVLDGIADLSEGAQQGWLFDGKCTVWDSEGNLEAEFFYDKGYLEGEALYYFSSGQIEKKIPYIHGRVHGTLAIFDEEGTPLEQIHFKDGKKDGPSIGSWDRSRSKYQEQYRDGLLINAIYFNKEGAVIAEIENGHGRRAHFRGEHVARLTEYKHGKPEGLIEEFSPEGALECSYTIKEGLKNGEEFTYYPSQTDDLRPKLMIHWVQDKIQGMVKTWYPDGSIESEREMSNNKKHGLSFAYYEGGDLMLMEEYENDKLVKGEYYKKGESTPTSTVEAGEGTATLFTSSGSYLQKIAYEKGRPAPK